jgi:hypothetical protein
LRFLSSHQERLALLHRLRSQQCKETRPLQFLL